MHDHETVHGKKLSTSDEYTRQVAGMVAAAAPDRDLLGGVVYIVALSNKQPSSTVCTVRRGGYIAAV